MNEAKNVACGCNPCSGSSCKCGCQSVDARATCTCGPQCRCGDACGKRKA